MSIAVDEVRDSIESLQTEQQRSLVTFITLDAALTAASVPFVAGVWLTVAREASYLPAVAIVVAVAAGLMGLAATRARAGDISTAVGWLAAGNWIAIAAGALLAPAVWPIYPIAALLPAVVAASYVRQDQFRWYLAASVSVATATTLLGLFTNITSIRQDVPEWTFTMLQAIFVPVMTGAIGFLALQNFARVRLMVTSIGDAYDSVRFQANDLFASRSRMIAATDRERRRIERNLHDGTQQHFVAMSMQLSALKNRLPEDDRALREQVEQLRGDVKDAQRNLRELTAAIYPPTLSQHGLTSAIRFIADRFTTNVTRSIDDVGRCDPEIEAAVYFTCMEALQNASKHAGDDAHVHIGLHRSDGELTFVVADDGAGFDPTTPNGSGGTTNMHDRMTAVLGTLSIESTPGTGTTVTGTVPVPSRNRNSR